MPGKIPSTEESRVPYVFAYGNIDKALDKIRQAATPSRFTQDFLTTKLALKGGSARPVIPFLKRIGFLGSDGVPTDLYKRFRNASESGAVASVALRKGFSAIFDINEYANELNDTELKGVIVQATGLEPASSTVRAIIGSFNALKKHAKFDQELKEEPEPQKAAKTKETPNKPTQPSIDGISLGYTINLHLPATSDIAVFDAIFKSLREHLMKKD